MLFFILKNFPVVQFAGFCTVNRLQRAALDRKNTAERELCFSEVFSKFLKKNYLMIRTNDNPGHVWQTIKRNNEWH